MGETKQGTTGAEKIRWDLTDLYKDVDDSSLDEDIENISKSAADFDSNFRGHLETKLGDALKSLSALQAVAEKLFVYLFLRKSTDASNAEIEKRLGTVQEVWSRAEANHLTFFEHELAAMDDKAYEAILKKDAHARFHRPHLDHIRKNQRFLLTEPVERALTLRGPYGPSEWSEFLDEAEADLRFDFDGESLSLPKLLHQLSQNPDGDKRASAQKALSEGLSNQKFDRLMARALNVTMGAKAVEDSERGYKHPMAARNIGNHIEDATVDALHESVATLGATQSRRYYRLLAAHLKKKKLRWSDRNAPLPFADNSMVSWQACVDTVLSAYGSFSPTLRDLVDKMISRKWVDAPPYDGKTGGAYNYSVLLPSGEARAYNFLNYQGSTRDVMTVAHELGHGVHGILAAEAQGGLMFRAPMAYAETASIFGEMTTFKYLLTKADSDEKRLALLMGKSGDHINTVVRQISFSNFERRVHEARKSGKLSVEDFNRTWMEVTHEFYGAPGELFTYKHTENLWGYVSHFMRPFYVYAYAFGELFTQSLFAVRERFGSDFEPMYLDVLKAGGSKSAVELMAPFDLDPRDSAFWNNGITGSISTWLDEAEALSKKMGISPEVK